MTKEEFHLFKSHQYCDNPVCVCYGQVGQWNLKINSLPKGQVYCKPCGSVFSVRRGTMFFGLRTPMDKIVDCLTLLASGMGSNAVCRARNVTGDSLRSWISLAADQVTAFTAYMQKDMHLEQVQIDEFWSFIRKKKENLREEEVLEGEICL